MMSNQQVPNQYTHYSRQIWLSLIPTIVSTAVLPFLIYLLVSPHMAAIPALLLASIPPAAFTIFKLVSSRRLNLIGVLALLGIAIKLLSVLLFKDVKLVLVSDSLMTGVYGILMLLSLPLGKPLLLVLAKNMLTHVPVEQQTQLEDSWLKAGRSYFTVLTAIWGSGLLLEMLLHIVLVYTLPVAQFLAVSRFVHYGSLVVLFLVSRSYTKMRSERKNLAVKQNEQDSSALPV